MVRAGNRGFSSLSGASVGVEPKPIVESLVVHPCIEMNTWYKKDYDCVINLRTQPRMLMRWPLDDSQRERERVSCALRDGAGVVRTMTQRVNAMGSLDQWCEDLYEMADFNHKHPVATKARPAKSGSAEKTEL